MSDSVKWQKVSPSGANKIYVSEADSDSPTNFGLVEKSISELKTLLGLPVSTYVGRVSSAGTAQPYVYAPLIDNFETSFFTLTEVVPDMIYTAAELVRSDVGIYYLNIGSKGGLPSGASMDIRVINKDGASNKRVDLDIAGAHMAIHSYDGDGNLADGLDIILTINKWT